MEIRVAKTAGFCFGVKRATDRLEEALAQARAGETIATLGHLIHNESYNEGLRRRGVLKVFDCNRPRRLNPCVLRWSFSNLYFLSKAQ